MSISQPIFTHKNISKALWDNDIHTLQDERKIVVVLHIYGVLAISLLFCVHQDTELEYLEMEIGVSQSIFTQKIPQDIRYQDIHPLQHGIFLE